MKKKTQDRVYTVWRTLTKVLSGLGAQDFELLENSKPGSREGVQYLRGAFTFEDVQKIIRVELMPRYSGKVGISSKYRDELALIVAHSRVSAKEIRKEISRLIDIWELGKKSEDRFGQLIKQSSLYAHHAKTDGGVDQHHHIDFYLALYKKSDDDDVRREGPRVAVDVKSSLPKNIPPGTLVYRRDDGVYVVDASEVTVAGKPDWADAVIHEILVLEGDE